MFFAAALVAAAAPARGSLITGTYELTLDQNVEKLGDQTTNIRKIKQVLELKYKGLTSPVIENDISFKIEQEINTDVPSVTRYLPTLDLAFKGKYWEAKGGVKRTYENSDDPARNPRISDSYFGEFFYQPPRSIPDLKAKYTLDTDFEQGNTDTERKAVTLSSVYNPARWIDAKGDYSRTTSDDKLRPDSDTEEEKASGSIAFKHVFNRKVKVDLQYQVEVTKSATLLDAGGVTNGKHDQKQTAKSLLAYRPFRDTSVDASYDFDLRQNVANGEHTLTNTQKVAAAQKIGKPVDVKGEFNRVETETRHTADDYHKTEDTLTIDVKAALSKHIDLILKRQDKHIVENHVDPTKSLTNGTLNDTATWTGELTPFWKASASYDRMDTYGWDVVARREVKTTVDTKYSVKSTFEFKGIRLTLDPSYDIVQKEDLVAKTDSATRDFKLKFAWMAIVTRTVEAKVDHTYGRKTDSGAQNIQRTDNSNGNISVKEALPGWLFAIDVTRAATDTSGDDVPPDINTTFGFKADYKYQWLSLSGAYKYDKKSLTASSETFDAKAGWVAPRWETTFTFTLTRTFTENRNEKYTLNLMFKYNL